MISAIFFGFWVARSNFLDSVAFSEQEQRLAALPAMPDLGAEFVTFAAQAIIGGDQAQGTLSQLGWVAQAQRIHQIGAIDGGFFAN